MSLKTLVVDIEQITEDILESVLSPYIRYDTSQRVILMTPESRSLDQKKKILIYLLAQKGWKFLLGSSEKIPTEGLQPAEIGKRLNLGDSVRPAIRQLKDLGYVYRQQDGSYIITSSMMQIVIELLGGQRHASP